MVADSQTVRAPADPRGTPALPGFFGKLPARGDFVGRRLDHGFRSGFDAWLGRSIAASQRGLGAAWLPAYLNAPIWRFVLGPGSCGAPPAVGVVMPSVDRVGRYFPLVLAVQLPDCRSPGRLFRTAAPWFERAEEVVLTSLDDEFDLDAFDREVGGLGLPEYQAGEAGGDRAMRLAFGGDLADTYARILDQVLLGGDVPFSLWWTTGSDRVRASVLMVSGMPAPGSFAAFLDGQWASWGWEPPQHGPGTIADLPLLLPRPEPPLPCGGQTHRGAVRPDNQDALLLRPELGLWAVADGAGGHEAGAHASRTVVAELGRVAPSRNLADTVADAAERLDGANAVLRRHASDTAGGVVASTAAVLLAGSGRYAVLWSGDSRAYRLRAGELSLLTRDHAVADGGALSHAIGAEDRSFIDREDGELHPGDRFLLCSDGVTKALDEAALAHLLTAEPPQAVAEAIVAACLAAGARDNVTAVVVSIPE